MSEEKLAQRFITHLEKSLIEPLKREIAKVFEKNSESHYKTERTERDRFEKEVYRRLDKIEDAIGVLSHWIDEDHRDERERNIRLDHMLQRLDDLTKSKDRQTKQIVTEVKSAQQEVKEELKTEVPQVTKDEIVKLIEEERPRRANGNGKRKSIFRIFSRNGGETT